MLLNAHIFHGVNTSGVGKYINTHIMNKYINKEAIRKLFFIQSYEFRLRLPKLIWPYLIFN